jgi:hypothetical protein
VEEVRGTFNMLPQYNSENYSVQGMLNEIRAMNTFRSPSTGARRAPTRHLVAKP